MKTYLFLNNNTTSSNTKILNFKVKFGLGGGIMSPTYLQTMSTLSLSYIKEKWQHAGFQKYLRNTGWMFFSRVLSMIISFFTIAIVIRYLGPDKYGVLSYAISFVGLFAFLASLGIDQILYKSIIKHPEQESEFLGTSFVLKFLGGLLAALVTIFFSIFFVTGTLEKQLIFIISLSYIFQAFNVINYVFQSRLDNKKLASITIATNVILSLLKITIVLSNKGVLFLSSILLLEPILYGIFFVFYYSRSYGKIKNWSFSTKTAMSILSKSIPLMFSMVFVLIYSRIDQIILKHALDNTAIGLYSSVVTISEAWYFIPGIICTSLFPSFVITHKNNLNLYNKRVMKLTVFLLTTSFVIALFGTFFAKIIINIIFGINFVIAYHTLQIYIWCVVAMSLVTIANQYLITEKLYKMILYMSIITMTSNVTLNLILIPKMGINGAATASLFSYFFGTFSLLFFKRSRTKILNLISNRVSY